VLLETISREKINVRANGGRQGDVGEGKKLSAHELGYKRRSPEARKDSFVGGETKREELSAPATVASINTVNHVNVGVLLLFNFENYDGPTFFTVQLDFLTQLLHSTPLNFLLLASPSTHLSLCLLIR
jgi:hypothetical protein